MSLIRLLWRFVGVPVVLFFHRTVVSHLDAAAIRRAKTFKQELYLAQVRQAGLAVPKDPIRHYLTVGYWKNFAPEFDFHPLSERLKLSDWHLRFRVEPFSLHSRELARESSK